jgi:hypothetical protein
MKKMFSYLWLGVTAIVVLSSFVLVGCGKKEDPSLDTAAPPPSTPDAQKEISPRKARPNAPPTMGGGPTGK